MRRAGAPGRRASRRSASSSLRGASSRSGSRFCRLPSSPVGSRRGVLAYLVDTGFSFIGNIVTQPRPGNGQARATPGSPLPAPRPASLNSAHPRRSSRLGPAASGCQASSAVAHRPTASRPRRQAVPLTTHHERVRLVAGVGLRPGRGHRAAARSGGRRQARARRARGAGRPRAARPHLRRARAAGRRSAPPAQYAVAASGWAHEGGGTLGPAWRRATRRRSPLPSP